MISQEEINRLRNNISAAQYRVITVANALSMTGADKAVDELEIAIHTLDAVLACLPPEPVAPKKAKRTK